MPADTKIADAGIFKAIKAGAQAKGGGDYEEFILIFNRMSANDLSTLTKLKVDWDITDLEKRCTSMDLITGVLQNLRSPGTVAGGKAEGEIHYSGGATSESVVSMMEVWKKMIIKAKDGPGNPNNSISDMVDRVKEGLTAVRDGGEMDYRLTKSRGGNNVKNPNSILMTVLKAKPELFSEDELKPVKKYIKNWVEPAGPKVASTSNKFMVDWVACLAYNLKSAGLTADEAKAFITWFSVTGRSSAWSRTTMLHYKDTMPSYAKINTILAGTLHLRDCPLKFDASRLHNSCGCLVPSSCITSLMLRKLPFEKIAPIVKKILMLQGGLPSISTNQDETTSVEHIVHQYVASVAIKGHTVCSNRNSVSGSLFNQKYVKFIDDDAGD